MMRTIEILLVIIIITGAFLIASFFAVLPGPRTVSPLNLRRLALTTLEVLDSKHDLSEIVFDTDNQTAWNNLQISLSASLPLNIVYNLTVYDISGAGGAGLYTVNKTISNAESLGVGSDAASLLVASSNATFNVKPEKIAVTLYILNCSDANGWWITGYTSQSLADDLYKLLSPYFQTTVMIQNTAQLGQILNGTSLQNEILQNAVIINTCGEAVPIPAGYYASPGVGYDATHSSYAWYCHTLGTKVRTYNWTWASIVGYPLYYVSNTVLLNDSQNTYGIYGMSKTAPAGLNAFLRGLDSQPYAYDSTTSLTQDVGTVTLSAASAEKCNYYGIYPSPIQTATRALKSSITSQYSLTITTRVFDDKSSCYPGDVYRHRASGQSNFTGSLFAIGLTRTTDVRVTALGILCDYNPRLYRSEHTVSGTSKLVVLQLGQTGGV
jgi:hypothetical protein